MNAKQMLRGSMLIAATVTLLACETVGAQSTGGRHGSPAYPYGSPPSPYGSPAYPYGSPAYPATPPTYPSGPGYQGTVEFVERLRPGSDIPHDPGDTHHIRVRMDDGAFRDFTQNVRNLQPGMRVRVDSDGRLAPP